MRLTLGWTFTSSSSLCGSLVAVDDPAARQVVGRQLHHDLVLGEDPDVVLTHLAADVRQDLVPVLELHPEHRVGQGFDDPALDLDGAVLLRHVLRILLDVRCRPRLGAAASRRHVHKGRGARSTPEPTHERAWTGTTRAPAVKCTRGVSRASPPGPSTSRCGPRQRRIGVPAHGPGNGRPARPATAPIARATPHGPATQIHHGATTPPVPTETATQITRLSTETAAQTATAARIGERDGRASAPTVPRERAGASAGRSAVSGRRSDPTTAPWAARTRSSYSASVSRPSACACPSRAATRSRSASATRSSPATTTTPSPRPCGRG